MAHESLRWGVLSTAKIGVEKVIPAIQAADGCEVVALASRDRGRAEQVAGDLGIARALGSYEELVDDPDIDAVYNPLPNHLHHEWTVAASRAGKHVLCEKPMGRTAEEARAIIAGCDPDRLLMEAFMYRFHPSWQAVRDLTATGIGELRAVHTRFSYFNDDPGNIRNVAEFGGGALLDIGCYAVSVARMLFDAEPTAVDGAVVIDPATGTDVLSSGLLQFPAGHATFSVSTRGEPDQRVTVLGSTGRLEVEIPFNIPPDRPTRVLRTAGGDPPVDPATEVLHFEPADQYRLQAEAFTAAALTGTAAPLPPADSVANLTVLDALRRR